MRSWAERKAAVAAEARAEVAAEEAARAEVFEAEQASRSDEDILEELGLPDPDTLEQGDDFKDFLAKGVPERIRTRALRRLWRLNPVLANVDGLVDYGEDFTDATCVIEGMQTAYQVGKGMLKHVETLAADPDSAKAEDAVPADETSDACGDERAASDDATPAPQPEPEHALAPDPQADAQEAPEAAPPVMSARRRMTFTFEETP